MVAVLTTGRYLISWYDDAMRTIVALPLEQVETLDALCRQNGISRAEGVRRAVAEHLARHASADRDRAFGLWRKHPVGRRPIPAGSCAANGRGEGPLRHEYPDRLPERRRGVEERNWRGTRHRLISVITWMEVLAGAQERGRNGCDRHVSSAISRSSSSPGPSRAKPSIFAGARAFACLTPSSGPRARRVGAARHQRRQRLPQRRPGRTDAVLTARHRPAAGRSLRALYW